MKNKILTILAVMSLAVCMAACSSGESSDKKDSKKSGKDTEEVTEATTEETTEDVSLAIGSTETWGDYTVGIPEGWTFRKGDFFDEEDTRYCSVKKSDFSYFDFKMEDDNVAQQQYKYNKDTYTNEQEDVSGTFGDISWEGFQYSDGWGGYGFELIASVNGKNIRVSSCGFRFDSAETALVLGSLVIG